MTTTIDTTETVGPLPVGYIEPCEQTGSDDETLPVEYVPLSKRLHRPRIFKDDGYWMTAGRIWDQRFRIVLPDGETIDLSVKAHRTYDDALATLRVESIKELGFDVDTRVLVTGNRFKAFDGDRGVDYRDCTGRVVKIDPTLKLPIEVEMDHHGYSCLFGADELEVTP